MPGFFSRYVILNTNNLPDGELELYRFRHKTNLAEFLVANAFFLAFRYWYLCRAHSSSLAHSALPLKNYSLKRLYLVTICNLTHLQDGNTNVKFMLRI
jgi:hypothetical protein